MVRILDTPEDDWKLRCRRCGNDSRFIQLMEFVENLVNADRDHVHLLTGIPEAYYCIECGERVADSGMI